MSDEQVTPEEQSPISAAQQRLNTKLEAAYIDLDNEYELIAKRNERNKKLRKSKSSNMNGPTPYRVGRV